MRPLRNLIDAVYGRRRGFGLSRLILDGSSGGAFGSPMGSPGAKRSQMTRAPLGCH